MCCKLAFFILAVGLLGCQMESYEGFRKQGRVRTKALIAELKMIRTKDQLVEYEDDLHREFISLRNLVDQVVQYQSTHLSKQPLPLESIDSELSNDLRLEILRIFRLEGGQEIVSKWISI